MAFSLLINKLIEALCFLPGVGPKSAQRMAFYLLERDRTKSKYLANILLEAIEKIGKCKGCNTLCEMELCSICTNNARDKRLLCIVEMPTDLLAIEKTGWFTGTYFVLMGRLSPIDGIGPESLGFDKLQNKLKDPILEEVIIATNTTVEGEATAFYIAELAKEYKVITSRIAHGVPLGGELEYLDCGTLNRALQQRLKMNV